MSVRQRPQRLIKALVFSVLQPFPAIAFSVGQSNIEYVRSLFFCDPIVAFFLFILHYAFRLHVAYHVFVFVVMCKLAKSV